MDDNPFFHRGALRRAADFYGRTAEIEQILGLLRNGQSVSLIGPRRIGKSSLLLHLCREETRIPFGLGAPQALLVMIDCQELGGSPAEEVYETLLIGLLDAAAAANIHLDNVAQQAGTYRALDRALNQVTREGVSVVVMLDEFELLAANESLTPYFFARLRGLTTKYGLAYVTASQRPLFAITADEEILSSPFFNIFVSLSLGLFSEEEARGLIALRLNQANCELDATVCNHLLWLVGPHPFFLHVAGYHAVQMLTQMGEVNLAQLNKAVELEAESHLAYLWQNLTAEEQYALATTNGSQEVMRLLEQQCLLAEAEEGNGRYTYTSEILRRFVRRQQVAGLLQAPPFVIDPERHRIYVHGQELSLTNSQFGLLVRLGEQAGQVVYAAALEEAVWGEALVGDPDRLKTLIKRLRRAIEPYDHLIVSERGIGYALMPAE